MRISILGLAWMALTLGACTTDKSDGTGGEGGEGGEGGGGENHRPVADAGSDVTQDTLAAVALDGRGSTDPDGDALTFFWSFDRVPEGSAVTEREAPFSENYTATTATTFRPDVVGTYIVKLTVKDEAGLESRPDYAVVTITDAGAPIADAGDDQEGLVDTTFTLDGTESYDPAGGSLTYAWSFVDVPTGSTATISSSTSATASFTGDKAGLYIASLIVSNGITSSEPDTALIRVSSTSSEKPVADAGDDKTVQDCMSATLDGSGTYDPNTEDELTYLWSIQSKPSGSSATDEGNFSDRTAMSPTFYPDVAGSYVISLTAFDGSSWATPDTMTVTATERTFNSEPTVEAGAGASVDGGSADCEEDGYTYDCDSCADMVLTLGGDASVSDGDGDPYELTWSVVSGSASIADASSLVTAVTLTDAAPTEPDVCASTEYVFQLSATDCPGETSTDTVTITVSCCGVAVVEDSASSARAR